MTKTLSFPIIFLLTFMLIPTVTTAETKDVLSVLQKPVQSLSDSREYGLFTLPNKMKVLLISDPAATRAAVSMSVGVGSSMNPDNYPGLAHFLEHMLFIGTKKYPREGAFNQYISDRGGDFNAETGMDLTKYYFSINTASLAGALDRFSQFFIAPLFDPLFVDKERKAVEAEYRMNIKDDARRTLAALQQAYNPASPYSRFSVGNLDTLANRPGTSLRKELLRFYNERYSANIMGLVVLGRESLPELKSLVEQYFSAVPNHNYKRYTPAAGEMTLPASLLPQEVLVKPIGSQNTLALGFPLPSPVKAYRSSVLSHIKLLLRDTSPKGVYDNLRERGWVGAIEVEWQADDRIQAMFSIMLELTAEGLNHIPEIEKAIYDFIVLLKKTGLERWRYNELQKMGELDFRYQDKEAPLEYVSFLSPRLLAYPAKDVIRAGRMMLEYNPELFAKTLSYLNPENAVRLLVDQNAVTDKIESYYKVPYNITRPAPMLTSKMRFDLRLPGPNPYIPGNIKLKKDAQANSVPDKLIGETGFTLWHDQDGDFGAPRAEFRALLQSPDAISTARNSVLNALLSQLVSARLLTRGYTAEFAGLAFSLKSTRDGILLSVKGYDEKLPLLVNEITAVLSEPVANESLFLVQKELLTQKIQARKTQSPLLQVLEVMVGKLIQPYYTPDEQLAVLKGLKAEDLRQYARNYFKTIDATLFAHGNMSKKEATVLAADLRRNLLANSRFQSIPQPLVNIPEAGRAMKLEHLVVHPDSVRLELYLDEETGPKAQAYWRLLSQLISPSFSEELRTRQQLGYLVSANYQKLRQHPGMLLAIQSSSVGVEKIGKRMATFLQDFGGMLATVDDKELQAIIQVVAENVLKEDEALSQRGDRYFDAIVNYKNDFFIKKQVAEALKQIKKQDLLDFYRQNVLNKPRRIIAWSDGRA